MSRIPLLTNLVLAAAVVLASGASATAGQEIPFQASGLRQHVSSEHVQGGIHAIVAIPDGKSNLGDWVGPVDLYIHGTTYIGTMTITFNAGSALTVAFMQEKDPQVGDFGGAVGAFVVTGGTGRFAGATGGGTMDALWMDKNAVEVLIVLDGTIVVN